MRRGEGNGRLRNRAVETPTMRPRSGGESAQPLPLRRDTRTRRPRRIGGGGSDVAFEAAVPPISLGCGPEMVE